MGIFRQFPYSNFHEMNMDEIIKIVKTLAEEWDDTKTEWSSYKEFIDNYFNNLNVSEEVLNAMRIFASDGTLNEIIDPVIATNVTNWLNENVTPTTPIIDASLTIAGAGADAQATGGVRDNVRILANNKDFKFSESVSAGVNFDSDIYLISGVKYKLTLNTELAGEVGCYVYGDSANAVYLTNSHSVRTYTPQRSGFLRFFPQQYTGVLEINVENTLSTDIKSIKDTLNNIGNYEVATFNQTVESGTNYDTDIYLIAGTKYNIDLLTETITGSIGCYVYGDSANAVYLTNSYKHREYTPGVNGLLRFYPTTYSGNLHIDISENITNEIAENTENINKIKGVINETTSHLFSSAENYTSPIKLKKGVEYKIYCVEPITSGYINCYIPGDSSNVLTLNKSHINGHFTPNIDGYLRFYSSIAQGSRTFIVKPKNALLLEPDTYYVGANRDWTSLIRLLIALTNDPDPKTIYIDQGEYDIWNEYKSCRSDGLLTEPTSSNSYFYPYNAIVSDNTTIIGMGDVKLSYMPADADVTQLELDTWSPLNPFGSVTIKNITIEARNCRYCIHDDDKSTFNNKEHIYENVNLILHQTSKIAQANFYYVTGFGFGNGNNFKFKNCSMTFDGIANRAIFYGHNNNNGDSANIVCENCVFDSPQNPNNTNLIRLQTLSTGSNAKTIKAKFDSCKMIGGVRKDIYNASGINVFDIETLNTGTPTVTYSGNGSENTDPFSIKSFNAWE